MNTQKVIEEAKIVTLLMYALDHYRVLGELM